MAATSEEIAVAVLIQGQPDQLSIAPHQLHPPNRKGVTGPLGEIGSAGSREGVAVRTNRG